MTAHRRKLILYSILLILIMGAIFFFSGQDGEESGSLSGFFLFTWLGEWIDGIMQHFSFLGQQLDLRKFAHMSEYFILGICSTLFFLELFWKQLHRIPFTGMAVWFLCLCYAASDEWHQTFVAGRCGCIRDVLIDGIGFTAAVVISVIVISLRKAGQSKH